MNGLQELMVAEICYEDMQRELEREREHRQAMTPNPPSKLEVRVRHWLHLPEKPKHYPN